MKDKLLDNLFTLDDGDPVLFIAPLGIFGRFRNRNPTDTKRRDDGSVEQYYTITYKPANAPFGGTTTTTEEFPESAFHDLKTTQPSAPGASTNIKLVSHAESQGLGIMQGVIEELDERIEQQRKEIESAKIDQGVEEVDDELRGDNDDSKGDRRQRPDLRDQRDRRDGRRGRRGRR